jgi:hypothetical protein
LCGDQSNHGRSGEEGAHEDRIRRHVVDILFGYNKPNMVRIIKLNAHPRLFRIFVLDDLKRMQLYIWIVLFESAFPEFDIGHIVKLTLVMEHFL